MKDPWRVSEPIRADVLSPRIHPGDRDFDADLRPTVSCVLRFKACAIEIASRDLQTERDALEALARTIIELKKVRDHPNQVTNDFYYAYAQVGSLMDLPPTEVGAARLSVGDVQVWFARMTLDEGAMQLVRDLIKANRNPSMLPILKRHGITPMLRA